MRSQQSKKRRSIRKIRKIRKLRSRSKFGYQAKPEYEVARDLFNLVATNNRGCNV